MSMNTVIVLIAAYYLFNERLSKVKLLAMSLLAISVVFVSLFAPDDSSPITDDTS